MKYCAIKKHVNEFPNPIIISKGDKITIGEESDEWGNWYFCETQQQVKGWVPKQVIQWLNENEGEAIEDYYAKEMDVNEGDILTGGEVFNGWVWCKNLISNEEGWVPAENLAPL